MKNALSALMIAMASMSASATVWDAKNEWTPEMSEKYSQWIANEFNEDFFTHGAWAGVATDCADAVYTARIIFSYENSLPFVIHDPNKEGRFITNEISNFNRVRDQKKRVRAFIDYVNGSTGTKTLPHDTYPVAINRENVKPGSVWIRTSVASENFLVRLFVGDSITSHAETVKGVSQAGNVYLIGSTVPARVRSLTVTSSFMYNPKDSSLGLREWILPQNMHLPTEEQPGYSLEQYTMGTKFCVVSTTSNREFCTTSKQTEGNYTEAVRKALAIRNESIDEAIQRYAKDLCSLAKSRTEIVLDAVNFKTKRNNACMSAEEYDGFSTPSRDKRIYDTAKNLAKLAAAKKVHEVSEIRTIEKISYLFDECKDLEIEGGYSISIVNYLQSVLMEKISSNPNDSLQARWGLASSDSNCKTY